MHLETVRPEQENSVHSLLCIPEVYKFLADGQMPPPSAAHLWVSSAQQDRSQYGGGLWAIKSDTINSTMCGLVRLADYKEGTLELTYLLHPSMWHQGIATRMAHSVIGRCFEKGRVRTIWAGADRPNHASIAVMQRLGMKFRNTADYPLGPGVEYSISSEFYTPTLHETIPLRDK